jgi:Sperm-tail PG-rich repeat
MSDQIKIEDENVSERSRSRRISIDGASYIRIQSNRSGIGKKVSIPTRFKTILTGEDRKKAFGCSSDRFNYSNDEISELPGPGSYSLYSETCWKDNKESMSRKGYGTLASITKRKIGNIRYANTGPGPNSYSHVPDNSFDAISQTSSLSTQATLMSKIRNKLKQKKDQIITFKRPRPDSRSRIGPGCYDIENTIKVPNMSEIPFKSRIQKLVDPVFNKRAAAVPAPGTYNLDRSLIRPKPYMQLGPSRVFCKTVVPDNIKADDYDKIKKHILDEIVEKDTIVIMCQKKSVTPSPQDYDALENFIELRNSKEFNVKDKPIGGAAVKLHYVDTRTEYPGPGQYKVKSYFDSDKYKVYNSVFISESERKPLNNLNIADIYTPFDPEMKMKKDDFHCNDKKKWL